MKYCVYFMRNEQLKKRYYFQLHHFFLFKIAKMYCTWTASNRFDVLSRIHWNQENNYFYWIFKSKINDGVSLSWQVRNFLDPGYTRFYVYRKLFFGNLIGCFLFQLNRRSILFAVFLFNCKWQIISEETCFGFFLLIKFSEESFVTKSIECICVTLGRRAYLCLL